jgi:hypothetical protein
MLFLPTYSSLDDALAPRETSSPPKRTSGLPKQCKHEIFKKSSCFELHYKESGLSRVPSVLENFSVRVTLMFDVRASALGDTSRKASHVPYRDSKLTRLLQVTKSQLEEGEAKIKNKLLFRLFKNAFDKL